jgi:hypothetical protein
VSEFQVFTNRKLGLRLESATFLSVYFCTYIFCELCGRYAANVIVVYICFPTGAGELYRRWQVVPALARPVLAMVSCTGTGEICTGTGTGELYRRWRDLYQQFGPGASSRKGT